MIITIDGPAAAGKGTLASSLARKYKYAYFDTGMVYRAVGLEMYLSGQDLNSETAAAAVARSLTFSKMTELSEHPEFRSQLGGKNASIVSAYPSVRAALLKMQQDFAAAPVFADGSSALGVVYDGRDTGTVVCPQADVKFFITATAEERAKRRYLQYKNLPNAPSFEEVLADLKLRDQRDENREFGKLEIAKDAVVVDTTGKTLQQVIDLCKKIVMDKLGK